MGRHSTYPLYNRLLHGQLEAMLTAWRTEEPKVSFQEIAVRLRGHGVTVTGETVRRWMSHVEDDDQPVAS